MRKKEIAGKAGLLTAGVGLVSTGASLVKTNLYAGLTIIGAGFGLIIVFVYLFEKEVINPRA